MGTIITNGNFTINNVRMTAGNIPAPPSNPSTGSIVTGYFGGDFTTASGSTPQFRLSKYTGSLIDTSFNVGGGFNSIVNTIATHSDGKVLVGGNFTSYSGSSINRIVRLNTNGTRDTSFNVGTGLNVQPEQIALQSDGKVIAVGDFGQYNGVTSRRLVRINTNGTKDTSFSEGNSLNRPTLCVAVQSDQKILMGGEFTNYSGSIRNCFVRLNTDGSIDTSFDIGSGFSVSTLSIATQSDGKILVGGNFTSYSGSAINRLVRLNTDGTRDTSFDVGSGCNDLVRSIATQSDGKILVGGNFTSYSGSAINRLVRLNTDGTRDTSFDVGSGFDLSVNSIAVGSNGMVLVGGEFTTYQGTTTNRGVLLNSNGSINNNTTITFNNTVKQVVIV